MRAGLGGGKGREGSPRGKRGLQSPGLRREPRGMTVARAHGNTLGGGALTYDFGRLESGSEPSVVAELAPAHAAPGKVLREAAHGGDEGGLAALVVRDRRARLLAAARGAVARDAVPERARQQTSGPVDGLHRGIGTRHSRRSRR